MFFKALLYITAPNSPGVNVRVLLCTMQFGPGYNQGTEKYIRNLARDLSEQGCDVVVAGGNPERIVTDQAQAHDENFQTVTLPTFGWRTIGGDSIANYLKLLSELKPDVLHMANPAHIGINILHAARELSIPYFVSVTDFWWLCPKHTLTLKSREFCNGFEDSRNCMRCIAETHPNSLIRAASQISPIRNGVAEILRQKHSASSKAETWDNRERKLREALVNATCVICLSRTGQKRLREYFDLDNCHYIPAGLAETWFEKKRVVRKENDRLVVGFLGAIAPHKGLHTLSRALYELADSEIELHVAGRVIEQRYADKALRQYANTHYLGELNEPESRDFLDGVDLVAIPSNSPENQPQVLLEAAARKKPTVASNIPGCAELLPKAALFPIDDVEELKILLSMAKYDMDVIGLPEPGLSAKAVSAQVLTEYRKVL
ncbi:glycosyltransferase [Microbulbifer sp.]|uniref:glycosyltransferase n=1 Tax=Microbulbifer sp. TaxID=1908541 RepID=UPI002587BDB3|nr:glycosyltransferase [Microbulbifer sp.]